MADKKITQLTNITGANLVDADEFVVVDISADETKAITLGELKEAFDSGSGFVRITGDTMTGDLGLSGADVTFGDNDKAIFGAGSDLQIYHDGANSYIDNAGTGNVYLRGNDVILGKYTGETYLFGNADGEVRIYHDGSQKFQTLTTGVDITGTLTSDGLTVDGASIITNTASTTTLTLAGNTGSVAGLRLQAEEVHADIFGVNEGINYGGVKIQTNSNGTMKDRLKIANNGDISFYEDTGTTPKFFWDASAESLGIGTSSPGDKLSVWTGSATGAGQISIGRTSADGGLFVAGGSNQFFTSTAQGDVGLRSDGGDLWVGTAGADVLHFVTNNSEKMRIDSSGHLLVGTTDAGVYDDATDEAGHNLLANGQYFNSAVSEINMILNKQNSDGDILQFRKDGTTVGSIGAASGTAYITGAASGLVFNSGRVGSCNTSGAIVDNTTDLGNTNNRFQDIYATNGTIQTSDRNEKQDIEALNEAETRVAQACKGLLRKFRWKDAVAEKGDNARIHFGIIAQDLQDAFAAEGLDAGRYAMFISSTWTDEETSEERTRLGVRYPELLAFIIAAI